MEKKGLMHKYIYKVLKELNSNKIIKSIRAEIKIKHMINFNRMTKLIRIQTSITIILRDLKSNTKLKE